MLERRLLPEMHSERTRHSSHRLWQGKFKTDLKKNSSQWELPSTGSSSHNLHSWGYSELDWIRPWVTWSSFDATPAFNRLGDQQSFQMSFFLILYSMDLKIWELVTCAMPVYWPDIILLPVVEAHLYTV